MRCYMQCDYLWRTCREHGSRRHSLATVAHLRCAAAPTDFDCACVCRECCSTAADRVCKAEVCIAQPCVCSRLFDHVRFVLSVCKLSKPSMVYLNYDLVRVSNCVCIDPCHVSNVVQRKRFELCTCTRNQQGIYMHTTMIN